MRCIRWAVCPALLFIAACGTSQVKDDSGGRGPTPVSFSRGFETYETRRGTSETRKPRGTLVDYDSEVLIRPSAEHLAVTAGLRQLGEPSARVGELKAELSRFEGLGPLLEKIAAFEAASARFFGDEFRGGMTLQREPAWLALTRQQLEIVGALKELTYLHVSRVEYDGRWNWKADTEEELGISEAEVMEAQDKFDSVWSRISPDAKSYVPAEITVLVNATTAHIRDRLAELERTVLAEARGGELEMEASLVRGDERIPVSISPYTIVEGVHRGQKSDRIGIPSQEAVARVQEEYRAYSEVADSINELIELAEDEERLREARDGIVKALRELVGDLEERLLAHLNSVLAAQEPTLDAILADVEALQSQLRAFIAAANALVNGARSSDPSALLDGVLALRAQLTDGSLLETIHRLKNRLENDVPAGLSTGAQALWDGTKTIVTEELGEFVDKIEQLPATSVFAQLATSLQQLAALARVPSFGDLEPGEVTRRPFQIVEAPDGIVDLAATPAESGDVLELRYKLSVAPPAGEDAGDESLAPTEHRGSQFLEIRKFGFYSTFRGQLLFYDRLHDSKSSFRAAPGICYNFHYRPDGSQSLFDVLAPGLGLSVSSPSFEDGTELAVGIQATLFDDMIQVGWAYNISVEDDPEMFYFGLDLIEAFQTFR